MGTAERKLEILKYLCKVRTATVSQLAELFDIFVRTIQGDIFEIETIFYVPLEVRCGKYGGGIRRHDENQLSVFLSLFLSKQQ